MKYVHDIAETPVRAEYLAGMSIETWTSVLCLVKVIKRAIFSVWRQLGGNAICVVFHFLGVRWRCCITKLACTCFIVSRIASFKSVSHLLIERYVLFEVSDTDFLDVYNEFYSFNINNNGTIYTDTF